MLNNTIDTQKPFAERLAAFYARQDIEKIIGLQETKTAYEAMKNTNILYSDKGSRPINPMDGQKAFWQLMNTAVPAQPMVAYIHIPFCRIRCTYCSFFKTKAEEEVMATYVAQLLQELELVKGAKYLANQKLKAVFFGGGTPGCLQTEQLVALIKKVKEVLPLAEDCEITIESSVHDMTVAKLQALMAAGANRFSFGVQTFHTEMRHQLGRPDSCEEVIAKLQAFVKAGAKVIIDLIYGLPQQDWAALKQDLDYFLECQVSGMDLYKLQIFPGTPMGKQFQQQEQLFAQGQALLQLFTQSVAYLQDHQAKRLSCCHWSTNSEEKSVYNTIVKNGAKIMAFGAGCGGHVGDYSYMQAADLTKYAQKVAAKEKPFGMLIKCDKYNIFFKNITGQFDRGYFTFAELPLVDNLQDIAFADLLTPLLEHWCEQGLMIRRVHDNDKNCQIMGYQLTPAGMFYQTQLCRAVMIAGQYLIYGPEVAAKEGVMGRMTNRK